MRLTDSQNIKTLIGKDLDQKFKDLKISEDKLGSALNLQNAIGDNNKYINLSVADLINEYRDNVNDMLTAYKTENYFHTISKNS